MSGPATDRPKLFYMSGTCALGVQIALEWAGTPYDAERVGRDELRSPAYLAINPAGVVPTLILDGAILTEASAILLALARRFPALGPAADAPEAERIRFERLIVTLGGTLHPHFWPWFVPQRYGARTPEDHARVKDAAERLIAGALTQLDADLGARPYFMGDAPSAVDAYVFPMARWGYGLETPTAAYPNLDGLMRRLVEDRGVINAMAAHGLPPLFHDG
ncbi:MAG: glutathione S-transferase family protein [Pseudomonadota bacterium]